MTALTNLEKRLRALQKKQSLLQLKIKYKLKLMIPILINLELKKN